VDCTNSRKVQDNQNDPVFTRLASIPPEVFQYRLGNRSALEWVIDQYQITTDKRSGIVTDPNKHDDPEYIVKLVERVVRVSIETVSIVKSLSEKDVFGGRKHKIRLRNGGLLN
jgi:predicted helicase